MKDYGSQYPVNSRRKRVFMFLASGSAAIFVFFALIAVGLTLLPAAIDAELDRRIAVVREVVR